MVFPVSTSSPASTAPWLGGKLLDQLTPEELLQNSQYEQSVEFGEGEFRQEVASAIGPLGQGGTLAETEFKTIGFKGDDPEDLGLLGFTSPQDLRAFHREEEAAGGTILQGDPETVLERSVRRKGDIFRAAGRDPQKELKAALDAENPTVFTIGVEGNTPDIQAHEARHVVFDVLENTKNGVLGTELQNKALAYLKKNIPSSDKKEEGFNRLFDAYRSTNGLVLALEAREDTAEAFTGKKDATSEELLEFGRDAILKMSRESSAQAEKFSKMEGAAQIMKGVPAPKGTTWQEFYFKLYLQRKSGAIQGASRELDRMLKR